MELRHVPSAKLDARATWQGLEGQIWLTGLVFGIYALKCVHILKKKSLCSNYIGPLFRL